jgi:recombination DNA repair RAD52 pathway protein
MPEKKSMDLVERLKKPLDPKVLKTLEMPNGDSFKYIPYRVILDQANEIFGPLGWNSHYQETIRNQNVEMQVWDKETKSKVVKNVNYTIVSVTSTISVYQNGHNPAIREGTGSVSMRTDSYMKSTDTVHAKALARADKSAFKKFGAAFGLGLIQDEEENEIAREEQVAAKLQEQRAKEALGSESLVDKITGCKTDTDLIKVAKLFKF